MIYENRHEDEIPHDKKKEYLKSQQQNHENTII